MAKQIRSLIERFDAGKSRKRAATRGTSVALVPEVVEGSVRELIDKFNGMSRSIPDVPRSAYRSTWSRRATSSVVTDAELAVQDDDSADTGGMHDTEEETHDGTEDELEEPGLAGGEDVEEEEGVSTCDETASIHSLSSSFTSDSSYDDYHQEAAMYYAFEYQLTLPQEETEGVVHATHEAEEPVAPPVSTASAEASAGITACAEAPVATTRAGKDLCTRPRALLPSKIPVLRRPLIRAANRVVTPIPAPVSGGSEARRPSRATLPASSPGRERRVVAEIPSRLAKSCPRFSSLTNTSSPRKPVPPPSAERREFMRDLTSKPAAARTAATSSFTTSVRSSAVSPQASRPPVPAAPRTSASLQPRPRTRSSSNGSKPSSSTPRPRESGASARPPTPAQDICLDQIKSRLFDYENDPKRLEMVAANRARRKSLEARKTQAV